MSSIALPGALRVNTFSLDNPVAQLMHEGDLGDSGQVVDLLKDRWTCSMSFATLANVTAGQKDRSAAIEAYFKSLRGMVNTVPVYHQQRPVPRGTLRGSPTLSASVSQGAAQIAMNATTGVTLLPGDMLGLAGRLYMVSTRCVSVAGVITVPLANRIRAAASSGAAVVWDRPSIEMRRVSGGICVYVPGGFEISPIELVEAISA
jgi:hypothetical protein